MKRKLVLVLCLTLLTAVLAACGSSGWMYDLPNGYVIHAKNGDVCLEKDGEQALGTGITAFCVGERFVGIRQEHKTDDGTETYWFLLDTENETIYAEEGEASFRADCESFGVDDLGDWIRTDTQPSGAHN